MSKPGSPILGLAATGKTLGDSVQPALGRAPHDFTDCARAAAANGAWTLR